MMRLRTALAACAAAFLLSLAGTASRAQGCSPPHRVEWPAGQPLWTFCWVSPPDSSGVDGSGLEIRDAFYKGRRVFWQASLPVLNVKYDPNGCGGSYLSYRDWQNQLVRFEADNVLQPGYAEPTRPPRTVCDTSPVDVGSFEGVALERGRDRVVLTTQMSAGWYRYIQKWTFRADGRIEPRLGFTAVSNSCTPLAHSHHGYLRLDFDVDGAADDRVLRGFSFWFFRWFSLLPTEQDRRRTWLERSWRVMDRSTGLGYEIRSGSDDGVADAWADADVWALRYRFTEIDDGGATSGPLGDAVHLDPYLTGEGLDGSDVVLWYRLGHRHVGSPHCGAMNGPTLVPVGAW